MAKTEISNPSNITVNKSSKYSCDMSVGYTELFYTNESEYDTITGTIVIPDGVTRIRFCIVSPGGSDSTNGRKDGGNYTFGNITVSGGRSRNPTSTGTQITDYGQRDMDGVIRSFDQPQRSNSRSYGGGYNNYGSGCCGKWYSSYMDVTPGQSIAYSLGWKAHKGGSGYLLVAYGGDI